MDTHDAARPSLDPAQPDPDAARRERALRALRALTGNPSADFHPGQFDAIRALVADRARALVVQRTGWGKSAVYFLSALLLRQEGGGPALIISPLLALMRDQVAAAERAGVRAAAVNSANATEWAQIQERVRAGELDVLLVSPHAYLTLQQYREMSAQPDLILQLAHHIRDDYNARGVGPVQVYADVMVSLNARPAARLIDPEVDLAQVDDGLAVATWILPAPTAPPPAVTERT